MQTLLAPGVALLAPLVLVAPGAAPLPGAVPAEVELAWTPRAGQVLRYTLVQEVSMELVEDELVVLYDGEEDTEAETEDSEHTAEHEITIRFTDELLGVEDGRLTALRRTFDEIAGSERSHFVLGEDFDEADEGELESPLAGLVVRFTRDADAEGWTVAWDGEEEGDDALLEHLSVQASLAELLPDGAVSEGDAWDAGPAAFRAIYDIGGDLAIAREGEDEEATAAAREGEARMLASLEGTVRCSHAGLREADGRTLCVIAIETDLAGVDEEEGEYDDEGPVAYESRTRATFALSGELLWDVEEGRAVALELSGPNTIESEGTESWEEGGEEVEMRTRERYDLEVRIAYTIEAR